MKDHLIRITCFGINEFAHAMQVDDWPPELGRYEKIKDELREVNDFITRAVALILPVELRNQTLDLAHLGHPGQSTMKSILRKRVWWPGRPTDVEKWVSNCRSCALTSRSEYPVPMKPTTLPEEPWEKLAVDFNGPHSACGGKSILVIVDYFSRFIIAKFVKSTDIGSVRPVLEETFGLLGNPSSIRSDNGPPFSSAEWKEFCENRSIKPEFSTPGHPQQNGLVERYM
jgi:transposase InsO family protein